MAVEKLKIVWNNLWRKGTILSQSSEDPQHPATDTQEDTKDMYWKSTSLGSPDYISLDIGEFEPAGIGAMTFDEGAVEPQIGEWLYGEGAQGKVVSVTKATGTWGVDATGSIVLEKCEGRFHDNEVIDGSIGGSTMLKVNEPDTGAGVDLVRNGEFEVGTSGWTEGSGGGTLAVTAGGKIGNCLKITESGANNPYAYQDVTVEAGKIYELISYIKAGTEDEYQVRLRDMDGGVDIIGGWKAGATADWLTKFQYIFEAPAGCTTIRIYLYSHSQNGEGFIIYFDEVSLYELDNEDTEKEIDFFALLDHNISPTATIELKGAWDTGFTEQVETITIPYHETDIKAFFTKTLRRYWKLEITDADNSDGYIKGGIILMGKYFQPNRNPSKEQRRGDRVFSEVELTETLSTYGKEKGTLEQAYLPFKGLTEADKDEIRKMMRECKIDHAFMIIYKPSDPNQDSVLYRFSGQPNDPTYEHFDYYNWEMNLIEAK